MSKLLNKLVEHVENQHGGCDEYTCVLGAAIEEGYSLGSVHLYCMNSMDEEFDSLYQQLSDSDKNKCKEEADGLAKKLPHTECKECGVIIWVDRDWYTINECPECGKPYDK